MRWAPPCLRQCVRGHHSQCCSSTEVGLCPDLTTHAKLGGAQWELAQHLRSVASTLTPIANAEI